MNNDFDNLNGNMLTLRTNSVAAMPLPAPRVNINIRPAVLSDIPFMDSLQKLHTKQVGWMPTKQFEGKIALGHVLIAEEVAEKVDSCQLIVGSAEKSSSLTTINYQLPRQWATSSETINTSNATMWALSIR